MVQDGRTTKKASITVLRVVLSRDVYSLGVIRLSTSHSTKCLFLARPSNKEVRTRGDKGEHLRLTS